MNTELNRLPEYAGQKLLCITHSDRPMHEPSCDINFLEKRYASSIRIPPIQPFESLGPSSEHTHYLGGITIYDIGDDGTKPPELVCAFRPETYKPQHCIWHDDQLWVLGADHIEICDAQLRSVRVIRDPWLAGSHTIAWDCRGGMLISCSASDSVLRFDEVTGQLEAAMRVPEDLYGFNYLLGRADSVVDHYVVNDLQLAHLNCAWPWRGGVLTSNLIHGAIGWFDPKGEYFELLRGFVGCHGARVRDDDEELFFSDSCSGMLVFLDPRGVVRRRVGTGSRWLHDAIQIGGDLFALAPFDRNEVLLMSVETRDVVARIPCDGRGGPQFLSFGGPRATAGRRDSSRETIVGNYGEWRRSPAPTEPVVMDLRRELEQLVKSRDALAAEIQNERAHAVLTRDAIISELQDDRARAVTERDQLIAEMDMVRSREVGLRDAILAAREAEIARIQADLLALRRDVERMTRGWRRWIVRRPRDGE